MQKFCMMEAHICQYYWRLPNCGRGQFASIWIFISMFMTSVSSLSIFFETDRNMLPVHFSKLSNTLSLCICMRCKCGVKWDDSTFSAFGHDPSSIALLPGPRTDAWRPTIHACWMNAWMNEQGCISPAAMNITLVQVCALLIGLNLPIAS